MTMTSRKFEDFAVFIMVHGRPQKDWTYRTLRRNGYTGKIYLVGDNLDETIDEYRRIWTPKLTKHGNELIVFDKEKAREGLDAGDNSGDLRSTLYSSNKIRELAEERGLDYYMVMCDDYDGFRFRFDENDNYNTTKNCRCLDDVMGSMLELMKSCEQITTLAFAQGGDFCGGVHSGIAKKKTMARKAMNSFLCSTKRPFKFMGRMNEDVTTYVNLGSRGYLFFTIPQLAIDQMGTQQETGGLTDLYRTYGTYVKSFFSIMYNPSSVKLSIIGKNHKRIHHKILWKNAVPKLLSPDFNK